MDYIKRAIEDVVLHSDKTFKSILITGARQTGKTKMIKELFPDKKYVLIDDPFIVSGDKLTWSQMPDCFPC